MVVDTVARTHLRDSVRTLLERRSGGAELRAAAFSPRGHDPALWTVLCEQVGVTAIAVPESYGGAGATLAEAHVVFEELGRSLIPCPLLGTVVATEALLAVEDPDACSRLLPGIAGGTALAAVAWAGPRGRWDPGETGCVAARRDDGRWAVRGEAHYVIDGDLADVLLVAANAPDGVGLFEVVPSAPGVTRTHTPSMDPTRRLATVRLDDVPGHRLGGPTWDARPALARVRDVACVALSAEQVGAATRALELTVEYTKTREQFGRPIGSFQALKHRMADLYVLVESARSASYAAADALGTRDLPTRAAVAKVYCSDALRRVAAEMIQLHGGIAITWEHDAHLYLKRAHGAAQLFGSPDEHVARLGRDLLPPPQPPP